MEVQISLLQSFRSWRNVLKIVESVLPGPLVGYIMLSQVDASGARILQETTLIPVNSARFQPGLSRNRREIYTEHGSSFPAGNSPYRIRRNSYQFRTPEKRRKWSDPSGKPREKHCFPPETAGTNIVSQRKPSVIISYPQLKNLLIIFQTDFSIS